MRLSECRFYCSGTELNFAIFSDGVCRAKYIDSITMTLLGSIQVDVYEIAPAAASRWVIIRETNDDEMAYKWFLREGNAFLEKESQEIPNHLRSEVFRRFPQLAVPMPWAA